MRHRGSLRTENRDFRKLVENSEFWKNARQKPPKHSADWCTKSILSPRTTEQRATVGRYAAVIEYLFKENVQPNQVAAELKERRGIDKVYAMSTGRTPKAKGDGGSVAPARNYEKDDLHAIWKSEEQRNSLLEENGDRMLKVRVKGEPGQFKTVTILEVRPS